MAAPMSFALTLACGARAALHGSAARPANGMPFETPAGPPPSPSRERVRNGCAYVVRAHPHPALSLKGEGEKWLRTF